jgi:hypothetical protein
VSAKLPRIQLTVLIVIWPKCLAGPISRTTGSLFRHLDRYSPISRSSGPTASSRHATLVAAPAEMRGGQRVEANTRDGLTGCRAPPTRGNLGAGVTGERAQRRPSLFFSPYTHSGNRSAGCVRRELHEGFLQVPVAENLRVALCIRNRRAHGPHTLTYSVRFTLLCYHMARSNSSVLRERLSRPRSGRDGARSYMYSTYLYIPYLITSRHPGFPVGICASCVLCAFQLSIPLG